MMRHRASLFAAVAFFCLLPITCTGGELISSWRVIDNELSLTGKVLNAPFQFIWTNSVTLRQLVTERHTNVLVEMAGQTNSMLAQFCGYFALKQVDRQAAQDAGINILLMTSTTNIVLNTVLERFVADVPNSTLGDALSRAFRTAPVDARNVRYLVRVLPYDFLLEWFENPNRPRVLPTCEAVVVDRLFSEMTKKKVQPTTRMQAALSEFARMPGEPRLVFVSRAAERDPRLAEAIRLALEDEAIPRPAFFGIVHQRARFIEKHVPLDNLNIPESRRSTIKAELQSALQFNLPTGN